MTNTGLEPATIHIAALRTAPRRRLDMTSSLLGHLQSKWFAVEHFHKVFLTFFILFFSILVSRHFHEFQQCSIQTYIPCGLGLQIWFFVLTSANNYHHTINRAAFVCLSVCLSVCLFPISSEVLDRSSPNLVGVCRWTSELPLRGSFSKRSTARRVNGSLSLSTILYMCQPHSTQLQKATLLLLQLIRLKGTFCCIDGWWVYVGGSRNWLLDG